MEQLHTAELLDRVCELANVGQWNLSLPTMKLSWSRETFRIAEIDASEEPDFEQAINLYAPTARPVIAEAVQTAIDTGKPYDLELPLISAKGNHRWVRTQGFVEMQGGKAVRLYGTFQDITAQKRFEVAMRESEARAFSIIGASPVPMALNNSAGRITFLNPSFIRTFGYELADIPTLADWWPKAYPDPAYRQWVADQWQAELERSSRTGTAFAPMDITIRCKDGSKKFVVVYAAPLEGGFDDTHLVVLHDISSRKQVETQLRESDERFRQLAENIEEVFWMSDTSKNEIFYISPAYERIWGRKCEELYRDSRSWMESIHPEDRERVLLAAETKQAVGQYDETYRILRPDGSVRWIHDRAFPVPSPTGKVLRIVGTAADVTDQRALEDQLRQVQKMETVGLLAGGVAHDFNNLLTVINGYSDLLLSGLASDDPIREQLLAIQEAGERASVLTQQLLAFGRKTIVAPKVIDLNDVVTSVAKMLRRLIGEDISLSCILSATACRVLVDPHQIEQVLMNFAVNARDAMPSGGRLTIETSKKDIPEEAVDLPAATYVRLSVRDTGVGMSDEVKSRIFEPFFTTKAVGKGTGLGLAVVYGIIAQAGGHIRVESTVGHGTTFEVLLPEIPSTQSDSTHVEPGRQAPRGSETILLVEDEEAVRRFTRHVIESHGYTVLEADSSDAAIRLTKSFPGPIHLLVTDVVMPDRNGRELAEAIRLLRSNLSVLYVSGYTNDALIRHGVEQEVDAFLQKPFTSKAMACKIREIIDLNRDKKGHSA